VGSNRRDSVDLCSVFGRELKEEEISLSSMEDVLAKKLHNMRILIIILSIFFLFVSVCLGQPKNVDVTELLCDGGKTKRDETVSGFSKQGNYVTTIYFENN